MKLQLHSTVDVITNSSNETYILFYGADYAEKLLRLYMDSLGDERPVSKVAEVYTHYDLDRAIDELCGNSDYDLDPDFMGDIAVDLDEDQREALKKIQEINKKEGYSGANDAINQLIRTDSVARRLILDLEDDYGNDIVNSSTCAVHIIEGKENEKYEQFVSLLSKLGNAAQAETISDY